MIRLDSTARKLQIYLGAAVATTESDVVVCYSDKTATTYAGNTQLSVTSGTTPVDICAAPAASVIRDIDYISVRCKDTAVITATISYYDAATLRDLAKVSLAVGDQLVYTHGDGWRVIDSSGALKTAQGGVTLTADEKAALAGTSGTPNAGNRYVTNADPRNSDARTPLAHTQLLSTISDVTITAANLNSLDDGVDSTLHFHDSDRARANHTGTQLRATISDFAHASTHLPSGADPLTTGTPAGLGNANAAGTADAFPRLDHAHKRDVRVQLAAADVGTRNKLNFIQGTNVTLTVTDDSVNDKVDVTVAATGGSTWTEAEIDFGSGVPQWDKKFTIVDAGVSSTSKIAVVPSGKTATGRVGADAEWDNLMLAALPATGQFTLFAYAVPGPIVGKRTIQYTVG